MHNKIPVACFAPPLTDELLARYRELAAAADGEIKDALATLLLCVETWWELPESTRTDVKRWKTLHRGRAIEYVERPLEAEHVTQLFDVTPWMRELDTLSRADETGLFDGLPQGDLRNAATHLLWLAKEITLDREPLTHDKLPA